MSSPLRRPLQQQRQRYNAVIVLDTLLFESLNNDNLFKYLENYFLVLWTSGYNIDHQIVYDGFINGLRNGFKPYKYLRMYLRQWHPDVLHLPVVIVDFNRCYFNSRYGYDMCIDINDIIVDQTYNNRQIAVIDTKGLFKQIDQFVRQYQDSSANIISEETIYSDSVVFTSNDVFNKNNRPRIVNKIGVLVVSPSIFENLQNVNCPQFRVYLNEYFLVVWMDNKNFNKKQISEFLQTMKCTYKININYMLFGLDRNVKTISLVRRHLSPTKLPFILIDSLVNIYNRENIQNKLYNAVCDFDYYINLAEYFVAHSRFYDMQSIFANIRQFVNRQTIKRRDKIKIVEECDSEDDTGSTSLSSPRRPIPPPPSSRSLSSFSDHCASGRVVHRKYIFEHPEQDDTELTNNTAASNVKRRKKNIKQHDDGYHK